MRILFFVLLVVSFSNCKAQKKTVMKAKKTAKPAPYQHKFDFDINADLDTICFYVDHTDLSLWNDTSFDGGYSQLITGYFVNKGKIFKKDYVYSVYSDSERDTLEEFRVEKSDPNDSFQYVSHNDTMLIIKLLNPDHRLKVFLNSKRSTFEFSRLSAENDIIPRVEDIFFVRYPEEVIQYFNFYRYRAMLNDRNTIGRWKSQPVNEYKDVFQRLYKKGDSFFVNRYTFYVTKVDRYYEPKHFLEGSTLDPIAVQQDPKHKNRFITLEPNLEYAKAYVIGKDSSLTIERYSKRELNNLATGTGKTDDAILGSSYKYMTRKLEYVYIPRDEYRYIESMYYDSEFYSE